MVDTILTHDLKLCASPKVLGDATQPIFVTFEEKPWQVAKIHLQLQTYRGHVNSLKYLFSSPHCVGFVGKIEKGNNTQSHKSSTAFVAVLA